MATVLVSANNTRVEDAEATTGWASIGGGAGSSAEPSFPYQGTNLVNRKVTSSTGAGFYYSPTVDGGSAINMTASATSTFMVKMIVTDYNGLQTANGGIIRIGSGTGAYYEFTTAGTNSPVDVYDNYPITGGFIIVPINPNISGYRTSTTGSPNLASVDYFGIVAAFAASTAKSENVGLDAIDLGVGLLITGGTSTDPDAQFSDFRNYDEGTSSNRFGFVTSKNGILNIFGTMQIGDSSNPCVFTDSDRTIVFPDGFFAEGWSGIKCDLQNASTVVSWDSITMIGRGSATVEETRPNLTAVGTSGSFSATSCTFDSFNVINLTSNSYFVGGVISNSNKLYQSGATLNGITVNSSTQGDGVAFVESNDPAKISNCTFNFSDGHAIEITPDSPTAITFSNNSFVGFGANGTNDAAIYNNSGKAITINITNGGDTPTIRNGTGASTTVNNAVTLTLTNLISDTEVRIYESGTINELAGQESVTGGTFQYTYNYVADTFVDIVVFKETYLFNEPDGRIRNFELQNSNTTIPINQRFDRNYSNP